MAKRKLVVKLQVAQRVFSGMVSLLLLRARRTVEPCRCHPPPVMQQQGCPPPPATTGKEETLVVDVDTALLLRRSGSGGDDVDHLFPYFMLVALEAGGFLRGLLLLLLYPMLRLLSPLVSTTKAMAAVAFCALRASRFRAGRAVLPKWFMEDVAAEAMDAIAAGERKKLVCVSRGMPRVMVDGFLREYLGADVVVGREMKTLWGFYTGLIVEEKDHSHQELTVAMEKDAPAAVLGFSGSSEFLSHPLARCCKEVYVVSLEERSRWRPLVAREDIKKQYPTNKQPAVVFHDGRLAFRPTPASTLAMFMWLPFGIVLGAARLAVALTVPYKYSTPILAATGMSWRLKGTPPPSTGIGGSRRGQLFVCNHRTLIDPVYVSVALDRRVRAVSYSLSRVSELISPIGRTVRLTRDRRSDGEVMARLLAAGDLVVVCPEGTTCREPYLLRFSPLFAELTDDGVVPVGIAVETSMFYATTAGGLKCFDPLYYMINPRMCYTVQFLDKIDTSPVREGKMASTEVANLVQRKMGEALGYGCTMLTRKDKYLMLAGNDGVVAPPPPAAAAAAAAAAVGKKNY